MARCAEWDAPVRDIAHKDLPPPSGPYRWPDYSPAVFLGRTAAPYARSALRVQGNTTRLHPGRCSSGRARVVGVCQECCEEVFREGTAGRGGRALQVS